MVFGEGKFRYQLVERWAQIPKDWAVGDVSGVAVDSRDRVFLFNRSEHPVILLDRDGCFLGSWGEGIFSRAHGITIARDDVVYCTDDQDHTVREFSVEGELLRTLGAPNQPSDTGYSPEGPYPLASIRRGGGPFNRPTKVAEAPNGELYVSDGYGNARIHRFAADGKLIASWGEPGDKNGQFNLPHTVWAHTDGRVFVCDRENCRIQIFDADGHHLDSWTNVARPSEMVVDKEGTVYLASRYSSESELTMAGQPMMTTIPANVSVRDLDGNVLAMWGGPDPFEPGSFASAHGICVDSHGDVYVGEVAQTALERSGRYTPDYPSIHKFVRV